VIQAVRTYRDLSLIVGAPERGEEFAAECMGLLLELEKDGRRYRSICLVWKKPWIAVGRDTYASSLLSTAGFENVLRDSGPRYPEVSLEEVASLRPEVIFLPDEPYRFEGADREEVEGILGRAGAEARTVLADGKALCWFGARTPRGLRYLRELKAGIEADGIP